MYQPYRDVIWSSTTATDPNSIGSQAFSIGVTGAVLGAAGYWGTRRLGLGTASVPADLSAIDFIVGAARNIGNFSPFQLLNTFRIPELLAPLGAEGQFELIQHLFPAGVSTTEALHGVSRGVGVTKWTPEFFETHESMEWLKAVTGKSKAELEDLGLSSSRKYSVEWSPYKDRIGGRLLINLEDGSQRTLAEDILLAPLEEESSMLLPWRTRLNPLAKGYITASGLNVEETFNPRKVFTAALVNQETGVRETVRSSTLPIPNPLRGWGSVRSAQDLARRTLYVRGIGAMMMERFSTLGRDVAEQFLGHRGKYALERIIGSRLGSRSLPFLPSIASFGLKAAALGGLYLGSQQLDWYRRTGGIVADTMVDLTYSAGALYAARKLNLSPTLSLAVAAGTFIAQNTIPGFKNDTFTGLSSIYAGFDIARAIPINPFTWIRRGVEAVAPGFSDWETGAYLGIGAGLAMVVPLPKTGGYTLPQFLVSKYGYKKFGIEAPPDTLSRLFASGSVRRRAWSLFANVTGNPNAVIPPYLTIKEKIRAIKSNYNYIKSGGFSGEPLSSGQAVWATMRRLSLMFAKAGEEVREFRKENPLNEALVNRLRTLSKRYTSSSHPLIPLERESVGFLTQALYSFFGATISDNPTLQREILDLGFGSIGRIPTPVGRWGGALSVFGAVLGLHQILTGGLLGSKQSVEKTIAQYTGEEPVEIKYGRWWEGGGTPFEGLAPSYYRPSAYYLHKARVREKAIWGENEDELSPITKWFLKNFTYYLERKNYWDRPYPLSEGAFQNVPIIGPALARTIGRIFKIPKLMHAEEWLRVNNGELEYAHVYQSRTAEPAYSLGASPRLPVNPLSSTAFFSHMQYQLRELEGMPGWGLNLVQSLITGKEQLLHTSPYLEDSSYYHSLRRAFWEANFGGGLFTNEILRRIIPHERSQYKKYNPIGNAMPSWLPARFHWGDPYSKIEWGEARLPGPGFAAMYPELRGINPENYPLIYRYQILSDVAPLSSEYSRTKKELYDLMARGAYTEEERRRIKEIDRRHEEQIKGYEFTADLEGRDMLGLKIMRKSYLKLLSAARQFIEPVEYLVPMGFRPTQKLLGTTRTPSEEYEWENIYGTPLAFWDKPIRDWFRPAFWSAAHAIGYEGKPYYRARADEIDAYFRKLEFIKWVKLAQEAEQRGDGRTKALALRRASKTLPGLPSNADALSVYMALNERDKRFLQAILTAPESEARRILELMPEDEAPIVSRLRARYQAGEDVSPLSERAGVDANRLYKKYDALISELGTRLPPPDWIGWHEDVALTDIKAKYLDENYIAADIHDNEIWESQVEKSQSYEYLEDSTDDINPPTVTAPLWSMAKSQIGSIGNRGFSMVYSTTGAFNSFNVTINDGMDQLISSAYRMRNDGY